MAILILLPAAGCGQKDWGYLSGTVRLNGEPVGPGSMSLERVDGQRAGAVAIIDDGGNYKVMSAGRKEGAAVGDYQVTFFNSQNFQFANGKIPAKYASPATSDVTVSIEPGQKRHDFDLKP